MYRRGTHPLQNLVHVIHLRAFRLFILETEVWYKMPMTVFIPRLLFISNAEHCPGGFSVVFLGKIRT